MKLNRSSNNVGGSSGDGHGRRDAGAAAGQFEVGDELYFSAQATSDLPARFPVLSVDHADGSDGLYFNFNEADVEIALGATFASDRRWSVQQLRNGVLIWEGPVVLWTSSNGGSLRC